MSRVDTKLNLYQKSQQSEYYFNVSNELKTLALSHPHLNPKERFKLAVRNVSQRKQLINEVRINDNKYDNSNRLI
jgi:hypothetical protein